MTPPEPAAPRGLPLWTRLLAESLPTTARAQLDLDHLHRVANPLGADRAAALRFVVADALRATYALAAAEGDLDRCGLAADDVRAEEASPDRGGVLRFARTLTLAASRLTDADVAALVAAVGPDDAVALVHTVAHANFQCRVFAGLGLDDTVADAAPPSRSTDDAPAPSPPPRDAVREAATDPTDGARVRATWSPRTFDELRARVAAQTSRTPRLAPPTDAEHLARVPRSYRMGVFSWGSLSMGRQPEMTAAWFRTMETFHREARLDTVLAQTSFWIVTRTNDCFY